MLVGYAFSAIILPLYAFVVSPMQVLVIRFAERVGKGIRTAPRDALGRVRDAIAAFACDWIDGGEGFVARLDWPEAA